MNQLPVEVTTKIISRLSSVKEKVLCKTLCKYWKDAALAALSRQECLSFGKGNLFTFYMSYWVKCWNSESHALNEESRLNIEVIEVNRFRRKFFSEFCCLKVIRFPIDKNLTRIWKYYLTEGPHQHLQCLQIYRLEFPVNLPNLQHLSCEALTVEVLDSIINNSPHLTQLRINVYQLTQRKKIVTDDFCDVLSRLPLGLKYLTINCDEMNIFAVLSSPAMATIKYLCFNRVCSKEIESFNKLTFRPSPNLETFGINGFFSDDRRCSNTLLHYLRTAKNIKKVELSTTWLSVEDRVTLFNRWSDMTMIKLEMMGEAPVLDELIDVILRNNRETLGTLYLGDFSVDRDLMKKLGNFAVLKKLVCLDRQFVEKMPELIVAMAEKRKETTKEPLDLSVWNVYQLHDVAIHFKNNLNITLKEWNGPRIFFPA